MLFSEYSLCLYGTPHSNEFISRLPPQGYESLVGERGVKLSGGQRQLIAIARAILKNAPLLIWDEATSQLDSVTESDTQKSLWELMQGKTTIVVAHRLSTLLHMDRILVFDKGKIIEDGTHQALLDKSGAYKTLWDTPIGGFSQRKVEECASRGALKSKRKVFFWSTYPELKNLGTKRLNICKKLCAVINIFQYKIPMVN